MKHISKHLLFFFSSLFTFACFCIAIFLAQQYLKASSELKRHGFDRAFIISETQGPDGQLSGKESQNLVNRSPKISDGALSVVSSKTEGEIKRIFGIDHLMVVSNVEYRLKTATGFSSDVTVFHITPSFVKSFELGSVELLTENHYIPSKNFKQTSLKNGDRDGAYLELNGSLMQVMKEAFNEVNLSQYRHAIVLSDSYFDLPGGGGAFERVLFTKEEPLKFSIPNIEIFPKIWVIAKLKDDADIDLVNKQLQEAVSNGVSASGKRNLELRPLIHFFEKQLSTKTLDHWSDVLQLGVLILSMTLLIMLTLLKFNRIRKETALRYALGSQRHQAAWCSVRSPLFEIVGGIFIMTLLIVPILFFYESGMFIRILPIGVTMIAIAVLSALALYFTAFFASRGNLISKLNEA